MANVPISNLTTTWNDGTTTFSGVKLNVTDTASASGSLLMDLQVGGTSRAKVNKIGAYVAGYNATTDWISGNVSFGQRYGFATVQTGTALLNLASTGQVNASGTNVEYQFNGTLVLARDDADTLAQRRTTNAQTFRIYNTYTDASNYERGFLRWNANVLEIGAEAGGTGSARALSLNAGAVLAGATNTAGPALTIKGGQGTGTGAGGSIIFQVAPAGSSGTAQNALATALTIGTAETKMGLGAQPIITFGHSTANSNARFGFFGGVQFMNSTFGGVAALRLSNGSLSDVGGIQFGGTTSSFPALKRSSTTLICRLADDSANAAFESASLKTDAPTGGTAATWKLGAVASVSPTSPNRTIEVDIGGTIYYLHAKTTND